MRTYKSQQSKLQYSKSLKRKYGKVCIEDIQNISDNV